MQADETLEIIEGQLNHHFWNEWIKSENPWRRIDERYGGWIYDGAQYEHWRKRYASVRTEQYATYVLVSVQCYHLDKYPRGDAAFGFEIRIPHDVDKEWIETTIERLYKEAWYKRYKEAHKQVLDELLDEDEQSNASEE